MDYKIKYRGVLAYIEISDEGEVVAIKGRNWRQNIIVRALVFCDQVKAFITGDHSIKHVIIHERNMS